MEEAVDTKTCTITAFQQRTCDAPSTTAINSDLSTRLPSPAQHSALSLLLLCLVAASIRHVTIHRHSGSGRPEHHTAPRYFQHSINILEHYSRFQPRHKLWFISILVGLADFAQPIRLDQRQRKGKGKNAGRETCKFSEYAQLPWSQRVQKSLTFSSGSSISRCEHTVVNIGDPDGPPRLVSAQVGES